MELVALVNRFEAVDRLFDPESRASERGGVDFPAVPVIVDDEYERGLI